MWERIFLALMATILLVMQSKSNSELSRDLPKTGPRALARSHDLPYDLQEHSQQFTEWRQAF